MIHLFLLLWLSKHPKSDCFSCQNTEVKFFILMQRSYNTNVVLSISDFHQKYIEVKTPRRSGWISNILSNKKLKSNLSSYQVYVHINNQKLMLPSIYHLKSHHHLFSSSLSKYTEKTG